MAVSSFAVLFMPIGAKLPADNLLRDMCKLLQLPHVIMFIFYLFVLGNCWGFIESYLFLYLKELGASNYLLGMYIYYRTYTWYIIPMRYYLMHHNAYYADDECSDSKIVIINLPNFHFRYHGFCGYTQQHTISLWSRKAHKQVWTCQSHCDSFFRSRSSADGLFIHKVSILYKAFMLCFVNNIESKFFSQLV